MGKEGKSAPTVLPYKVSCQQKIRVLVCYINCKEELKIMIKLPKPKERERIDGVV